MIDWAPPLLIICAVGTYVLGFLFRDQLVLRALVVAGSVFYAVYYWIAGPAPLWDAIIGSILIGLSALQGMLHLSFSRLALSVPRDARHVYAKMGDIEPGLFRRLINNGERFEIDFPLVLTREGERPEVLWFVVNGSVRLEMRGRVSMIEDGCFIGEIAWLRKCSASATAIAMPGSELVGWRYDDLRQLIRRHHRLEMALESLIAQNIARKLSVSIPITGQDLPLAS